MRAARAVCCGRTRQQVAPVQRVGHGRCGDRRAKSAGNRRRSGAFRPNRATRQRVADHVFESLARAILNGNLKPDAPLTTQRDLARAVQRLGAGRAPGDPPAGRSRPGARAPGQRDDRARPERVERHPRDPVAAGAGGARARSSRARVIENHAAVHGADAGAGRAPHHRTGTRGAALPGRQHPRGRAAGRGSARSARSSGARSRRRPTTRCIQQQVRWWWRLASKLERRGREMRVPPGPRRSRSTGR